MSPLAAAVELEKAQKTIRDLRDAGRPVTNTDWQRVADAEKQLDAARAQVGGGVR